MYICITQDIRAHMHTHTHTHLYIYIYMCNTHLFHDYIYTNLIFTFFLSIYCMPQIMFKSSFQQRRPRK